MKNKKGKLLSICCNAPTKYSEILPDFIGDNKPKTGNSYCICSKCGEACSVYLKQRKTWDINPQTKIIPNKKRRLTKLSPQELKKIKQEEDF